MSKLSRRRFVITAGAAAAGTLAIHGCSSANKQASTPPDGKSTATAAVSAADTPETTSAKLGFIALTDSAPLIVAKEKGLFDKYGMTEVEVVKQASWPVVRDNLELGSGGGGIDGAHILSPMPYMMTLGTITKTKQPVPMYILARLNLNGQGISVSDTYKDLKISLDSAPLKQSFAQNKGSGDGMKVAVTFPGCVTG
jgi:nitrate/nitrite transport system substrate-binding protein